MHYDLVILDELGYISFDIVKSQLFFKLLFNKWSDIFVDPIITTPLVDKLTHKAYIINIKCDSYRLRETLELEKNKDLRE
ncbi:MAG: ATP-binding protein [Erysipelotrichaceae bacterium]